MFNDACHLCCQKRPSETDWSNLVFVRVLKARTRTSQTASWWPKVLSTRRSIQINKHTHTHARTHARTHSPDACQLTVHEGHEESDNSDTLPACLTDTNVTAAGLLSGRACDILRKANINQYLLQISIYNHYSASVA